LQRQKVLVRFEVRVVLADRNKSSERAAQLRLRFLKLLQRFGIRELVDANLDLRRFRACLDHLSENLAFLARVASHSLDQVGNELSAPLVLILNLAPGSLGALLERRDRVDAAPG